ncbi:unnamed protein product [Vitrella brassicaformis CCMP3155]|uniref:3'(2'),5'-bisphosphate nucleotidase 1 n=2 Tax=Vitrella brassicaformis TaxID=1169539 RepID=A0A0G4ENA2_VITBC|nr:unnamed protein product [Vitrella brassicaformis CCMP3155]|eukprot:CEL98606.1 unnamed protein product [Vitrella brassicaformis CCMP3155]
MHWAPLSNLSSPRRGAAASARIVALLLVSVLPRPSAALSTTGSSRSSSSRSRRREIPSCQDTQAPHRRRLLCQSALLPEAAALFQPLARPLMPTPASEAPSQTAAAQPSATPSSSTVVSAKSYPAPNTGITTSDFLALSTMKVQCGSTLVDVLEIVKIAKRAGAAIMAIYEGEKDKWEVEMKSDSSPLTAADREANKVICEALATLYPNVPIVSEENEKLAYEERKNWEYYFCVDPLDGTKEFIKRNGQFTVNIGICKGPTPIAGVVTIPAQGIAYWAAEGLGAYKEENDEVRKIQAATFSKADEGLTIVASRSHNTPETQEFISKYKNPTLISLGSSIKLMLVAEGTAHVYPRLAPTCEWDTCAAHAIVNEAGGRVVQATGGSPCEEGEPVRYNKENTLNPFFVVYGNQTD